MTMSDKQVLVDAVNPLSSLPRLTSIILWSCLTAFRTAEYNELKDSSICFTKSSLWTKYHISVYFLLLLNTIVI